MTTAQRFNDALNRNIKAAGYGADSAKVACYQALVECGILAFNGASFTMGDRDPIVELRECHDVETINAAMMDGWRLLGADAKVEGVFALLGRPQSVKKGSSQPTP